MSVSALGGSSWTVARGVSAFPITPCDPDGRVDALALRRLLARLYDAKVASIGLLGSTGSYPYLSRAERRRALEIAVDAVSGRLPILVGVGALRTDEAVALAQDARAIGATAGLVAPVSYTPLTEDEVFEHVTMVAWASGLSLCLYDNPSTTHFKFGTELVARLARVAGVVALKSPAPEAAAVAAHLADLRRAVPAGFSLGYSGDWNAVEALLAGGDVWYSVLAGLFPLTAQAIWQAIEAGDADEARRLDALLAPLWGLFKAFSSVRVMYAFANDLGLCDAQPPRPLLPLAPDVRDRIAETLRGLALS